MKKLYLLLSLFLTVVITFNGCKKEKTPPETPVIKLAPHTYIIDDQTSQSITLVDTGKVIFTGTTTQLQNLLPGDIIVSGIATNAPYGFLRKIISIWVNGNVYTVTTQEVPMTDAFEELHVHLSKPIGINDTVSGKKESLEFTVNLPNLIVYDADGNNATTSDQIKLDGSISFTPTISADIDISTFTLHYAKVNADFETQIQTQITAGGSLASFSREITVYQQPIAAVPIPGTPVVIVPLLRVNIGANGVVNVQISASYTNNNTIGAYIEYSNGAWTNGYTKSMQNTYSFSGLQGYTDAKTYVEPGIDFSFWGSNWATGSIVTQGYVKFHGQLLPVAGCDLKAGISAGAEANVQIFGWNFATISYPDIFDYSTTLYTCSSGTQTPVADFSASQTSISTTQSINFTDLSTNSPTSWEWTFTGATPSTSTQQNPTGITYNNAGTYDVTLTATNTNGTDGETKTGYIVVTQPGSAPVANFSTSSTAINTGQSISFTDLSTGTPTSWQWNFSGGTPSSSTSQNPSGITYNTVGTFDVTLTVTNANGSDGETKTGYIVVTQGGGASCSGTTTVTDIDGNVYNIVTIGNQCWMQENLKTTRYNNGDAIGEVEDSLTWATNPQSPAWCYYNGNAANNVTYGKLYNWYVVDDPRNVCPSGWHVPTDTEWHTLALTLDAGAVWVSGAESATAGSKLKTTTLWYPPNTGADNSSGFTALPGGYREWDGRFFNITGQGHFWTSTPGITSSISWSRWVWNAYPNLYRYALNVRRASSIRCLKD